MIYHRINHFIEDLEDKIEEKRQRKDKEKIAKMWMKRGTNDVEYKKTGYTVACDWAGAVMLDSRKRGSKKLQNAK